MWAAVAGAAVSVVGGAIASNKAKKGANQQVDYQRRMGEWAGLGTRQSGYDYANEMDGFAQDYRDYSQRPSMSSNGYGTSYIDPATGQNRFWLNGDYQGMRDGLFGGAMSVFDQAGSFDPKEMARERYGAAQALLAPGDQQAKDGLMQELYNKGGFGLTTNQSSAPTVGADGQVVAGSGSVGVNPYVGTFMNARNQRDANMAYGALGEGEKYLDGLINRGTGMFRTAQGIDQLGVSSMNTAMDYRNQYNRDYGDYLRMRDGGARARLNARNGYYTSVAGLPSTAGMGANADSQMWQTGTSALSGMVGRVNWGGMFGGGDVVGGASGMTSAPIYDNGRMVQAPIYNR